MQVKEKNIEQQIQLWAIAGPFVTLLTLLVSMMKPNPMQTSFAICLMVGVPLCWKWKLKGLAISVGLLLGVVAFHFADLEFSTMLWSAGLSVSGSLSFLITALSFDEVAALTDTLQIESKSRLENLLKLDEKLKVEKESHVKNQERLAHNIKELEEEVVSHKSRAASNERLAQVVREELAATHSRNDELLQEVFDWRHKYQKVEGEVNSLREGARVAKESVDRSELDVANKEISSLQGKLEHVNEQLETVQAQFEYSEEQRQAHEVALLEKTEEYNLLEEELEETRLLYESTQEEVIKLKDLLEQSNQHDEEVAKAHKLLDEQSQQLDSIKLTLDEREQELVIEKQKIEELQSTHAEKEMVLQQLVQEAQAERDGVQAERDEIRAERDAAYAERDVFQVERDEARAERDGVQAERDEIRAERDAAYAERNVFQVERDQARAERDAIQTERDEVKAERDAALVERDEVKAKVLEKPKNKESAELRKIKGKHTQLQKQFKEKSEVLDETRRALFHMQEKLLTAQRETEEARKADKSDTEELLEQTIAKMESERKELEENHQQEIDDLHEIIASLSSSN